MTDWNSSNRMPMLLCLLERINFWRIVRSFCCLFSSSHSVLSVLSKSNPNKVFRVNKLLSPFFILLSKIGSLSLLSSVRKQSWMPCMVTFATCSICSFFVGITIAIKLSTYTSKACCCGRGIVLTAMSSNSRKVRCLWHISWICDWATSPHVFCNIV